MNEWKPIETAPDNVVVMTKRDDPWGGERNVQPLKKDRDLWWFEDGSMYVYYSPTHWKPLPEPPKGE